MISAEEATSVGRGSYLGGGRLSDVAAQGHLTSSGRWGAPPDSYKEGGLGTVELAAGKKCGQVQVLGSLF